MNLTREEILAMAPDAASRLVAARLALRHLWSGTGEDGRLIWAEHLRDGQPVYRVSIALRQDGLPVLRCDCPSRKRPCKHALGLLLLRQSEDSGWSGGEPPAWAELSERAAEPAAGRRPSSSAGAAKERRAAAREERVRAGLEVFEQWLCDLIGMGLARALMPGAAPEPPQDVQPYSVWEEMIARLVDAQAPGLASQLQRISLTLESPDVSADWAGQMLERIGRLFLTVEAYQRLSQSDAAITDGVRADLRAAIGWAQRREDLADIASVGDRWLSLGQTIEEVGDRLRARRTWLWGLKTRRPALLLDYAVDSFPPEQSPPLGRSVDGELRFFPGSFELRAALMGRKPRQFRHLQLPDPRSIGEALTEYARALALNPLLEIFPLRLGGVTILRRGSDWLIADRDSALPLAIPAESAWRLLAASGGGDFDLFGEWSGDLLRPVTVVIGNEWIGVR